LGYGDIGSSGVIKVKIPNIDRLAYGGFQFTNANSPAATCTPSRYAMLTGKYAWCRKKTGIARDYARMIIQSGRTTLTSVIRISLELSVSATSVRSSKPKTLQNHFNSKILLQSLGRLLQ